MILKVAVLLASLASAEAQTAFKNLDFEQASPVPASNPQLPGAVTAASAFPDWTIYCGTVQQTQVLQNGETFGQAIADIFGPTSPPPILNVPGIIDGQYSAALQGGAGQVPGVPVSASIEQTGLVPAGDQSIEFKAWGSPIEVSLNGNTLPLVTLETTANYTLYGASISAYAGETATLDFICPPNGGAVTLTELDDITFSTSSAPEPSPALLAALGGLIFATLRRKMRR